MGDGGKGLGGQGGGQRRRGSCTFIPPLPRLLMGGGGQASSTELQALQLVERAVVLIEIDMAADAGDAARARVLPEAEAGASPWHRRTRHAPVRDPHIGQRVRRPMPDQKPGEV